MPHAADIPLVAALLEDVSLEDQVREQTSFVATFRRRVQAQDLPPGVELIEAQERLAVAEDGFLQLVQLHLQERGRAASEPEVNGPGVPFL